MRERRGKAACARRPTSRRPQPAPSTKKKKQARAAGAALAAAVEPSRLIRIAVSPYMRCLQTAAGVLAGLDAQQAAGVEVEGGHRGVAALGKRGAEGQRAVRGTGHRHAGGQIRAGTEGRDVLAPDRAAAVVTG
jgi:hypothetical protein